MGNSDELKNRAIVTVLGKDRSGIVAEVARVFADHQVNILDITQSILQGIFTMTMLVDLTTSDVSFAELQHLLNQVSDQIGLQITMQREEVFNYMHRL